MAALTTISSTEAFSKESVAEIRKEMKEIKSAVVAQWEPDDSTVVSPNNPLQKGHRQRGIHIAFHRRLCP